jgi:hypothetical protein
MRKIVSIGMLILTCSVLVSILVALANARFDVCDPASMPKMLSHVASNSNAPAPTPAPPRGFVTLQVQTDHSELEVGWAEN